MRTCSQRNMTLRSSNSTTCNRHEGGGGGGVVGQVIRIIFDPNTRQWGGGVQGGSVCVTRMQPTLILGIVFSWDSVHVHLCVQKCRMTMIPMSPWAPNRRL